MKKAIGLLLGFLWIAPSFVQAQGIMAEALEEFDDGTLRVVRPYTELSGQGKVYISSDFSSAKGICGAFGYQVYLQMIPGKSMRGVVKVDGSGRIIPSTEKSKGAIVDETICLMEDSKYLPKRSTRARIESNADRTVTLHDPRFGSSGKDSWPVSADSHSGGVCRLFGFETVKSGSNETGDSREESVQLNKIGRYVLRQKSSVLKKITCMRELRYRVFVRFDANGIDRTLKDLTFVLRPSFARWMRALSAYLKERVPMSYEYSPAIAGLKDEKETEAQRNRNFAFLLASPILSASDSNWYSEDVTPILKKKLEEYQAAGLSLTAFPKNDVRLAMVLRMTAEAIQILKDSNEDVEVLNFLNDLRAAIGLSMSSQGKLDVMMRIVQTWDQNPVAQKKLFEDPRLYSLAQMVVGAMEYLR
jgi:hypothetical protein